MNRCFGESMVLGRCEVLYTEKCNKEKGCPFYKSVEKAAEDCKKAEERCEKLNIPYGSRYVIWKKAKDLAELKQAQVKLP